MDVQMIKFELLVMIDFYRNNIVGDVKTYSKKNLRYTIYTYVSIHLCLVIFDQINLQEYVNFQIFLNHSTLMGSFMNNHKYRLCHKAVVKWLAIGFRIPLQYRLENYEPKGKQNKSMSSLVINQGNFQNRFFFNSLFRRPFLLCLLDGRWDIIYLILF